MHPLILIGGSAGSLPVLRTLLGALGGAGERFEGTVAVVVHQDRGSGSRLAALLQGFAPALEMRVASLAGEPIAPRTLMVPPPNHHLLFRDGRVWATQGPEVNRFRPSIDVLFRSAACLRDRTRIGVLLSGYLHDGVDGLQTLVEHGGSALLQDPEDAQARPLIDAALAVLDRPLVAPESQLPSVLRQMLMVPAAGAHDASGDGGDGGREPGRGGAAGGGAGGPASVGCSDALRLEIEIDSSIRSHAGELNALGEPVGLSCPDCGGPMWKVSPQHIRCHVGHGYNPDSWLDGQRDALQRALWSALRIMEEKKRMLQTIGGLGSRAAGSSLRGRIDDLDRDVDAIRALIGQMHRTEAPLDVQTLVGSGAAGPAAAALSGAATFAAVAE